MYGLHKIKIQFIYIYIYITWRHPNVPASFCLSCSRHLRPVSSSLRSSITREEFPSVLGAVHRLELRSHLLQAFQTRLLELPSVLLRHPQLRQQPWQLWVCLCLSWPVWWGGAACWFLAKGFCSCFSVQVMSDFCSTFVPSIIFVNLRVSNIPTIFIIHFSMDSVIISNCYQIIQ